MKLSAFLILLLFTHHVYSQAVIVEYQLPKKQRAIKTSSVKLNDSTSLHFAITKNRRLKKIELKPFLIIDKAVKELNSLFLDNTPNIKTAHLAGDIITIIYEVSIMYTSNTKKKIYGVDINTKENLISLPKEIRLREYKTLITTNNTTYFFGEMSNAFFILNIKNMDNITRKFYRIKSPVPPALLTTIKTKKNTYINTEEFINVGSTSPNQIYKYGDVFYVTYDNNRTPETYIFALPFGDKESYEVSSRKFRSSLSKNRVHKSFLTSDHLFQFSVGRKEAIIDVFNYNSGKRMTSFYYSNKKFGPYHEYYFKGKKTAPKEGRFFKSFNGFRLYSTYLVAPFITVNKASGNGYIIEIGHVNGRTYIYDPFLQGMMWDHHQMLHQPPKNFNMPKFSPGPYDYSEYNFFYEEPITKTAIKLSLDSDFNPTETLSETIYKYINYNKTMETINTGKNKASYVYLNNNIKYMVYNRLQKKFSIKERKVIK